MRANDAIRIRETVLQFACERTGERSFCPSEVARRLGGNWRGLMPSIREVAATLVSERRLQCTQGGRSVNPLTARGPIRLRGMS